MKRLSHIISFILVLFLVFVSFYSLMPKTISDKETPLTEFSTARALSHLNVISAKPHFVGTAAHTEVQQYIVQELRKLGLEPQVQEGFVNEEWNGYSNLTKPQNILARIKGSGDGKALLLMSHYDSAPHSASHGASDAGSGVVTILESVRAYLASGVTPVNDIIICITDAEEIGLDGAQLFVDEHPWAKDVGLALNFEARGSGGPSNMIVETNHGNKNLINGFMEAGVEYPVGTSLMYSIYKMLPNDTDSTVLREDGDIDGFFFAFIDDHFDYHTVNDTFENLDRKTLDHQGTYLMPLLKHFAATDLTNIKSDEDYVYFDSAVANFVAYPFSWIWPMVVIAIVLFIALLVYGFKKEQLRRKYVARGFSTFFLTLILGGGLFYLLWELLKYIYTSYEDMLPVFIYNGHWYIIAFALLGFSLCMGIYHRLTVAQNTASNMVAPLTMWLIINILVAVYLKGAAFFIIPVFFGLIAFYVLIAQRKPSVLLLVLLCAPAIFLLAPLVQFFPVGLGPDMLYASVIFLILLFGLVLPVFGLYRNKKFLAYLSLLGALVCFGIAHMNSDAAVDRQAPNSLIYYQNTDTNRAYWATYNKSLDDWTKGYLGENPEQAAMYIGNAAGSKYNTPYTYAKETAVIDLPESTVQLDKDTLVDGLRYMTLTVTPNRTVHQMRMYTAIETPLQHISWNGVAVKADSTETLYKKRGSKGILSYYRGRNDKLEFKFAVPEGVNPKFTLKEFSYDLLENPKFTVSARPKTTMPKPFVPNDAIIVERTIDIAEYAFAKAKNDTINTGVEE